MIRDRIVARQRQAAEREQVTNRGAVDINKVDQALYRPDLGFKLTNKGLEEFGGNEAKFQQEYETVTKSNREAINANTLLMQQLQNAQGQIERIDPEALYSEVQKGFVPVMIGTTKEQSYPKTFMVPREAAENLISNSGNMTATWFEVPPGQITNRSQWTTNTGKSNEVYGVQDPARQNYLVISPYIGGKGVPDGKYVNEIAGSFNNLESELKGKFFEQLKPKLDEAQKMYGSYETKKQEAQKYIDLSTDTLNKTEQARTLRENEKGAYKKQYEQSVSQRQALFR